MPALSWRSCLSLVFDCHLQTRPTGSYFDYVTGLSRKRSVSQTEPLVSWPSKVSAALKVSCETSCNGQKSICRHKQLPWRYLRPSIHPHELLYCVSGVTLWSGYCSRHLRVTEPPLLSFIMTSPPDKHTV